MINAKWDGTNWSAVGNNGLNGSGFVYRWSGANLYAGGAFTNTSLGLTNLARWDGSSWSAIPGGGANGQVEDLVSDGANLYAGGAFTNIGTVFCPGVARFNGATWTNLGPAFQNSATPLFSRWPGNPRRARPLRPGGGRSRVCRG